MSKNNKKVYFWGILTMVSVAISVIFIVLSTFISQYKMAFMFIVLIFVALAEIGIFKANKADAESDHE